MKITSYQIILILFLSLGCYKVSAQTNIADPHTGHGSHQGHTSSGSSKVTAATKKYQQINDNMHKSMDIKFTGDADKDFLAAMIPHHQGAIDMAEVVVQYGKNPKVRQLAQEIITMQKKEIAEMRQLLKESK
ncbi:MAG: DUF305 domain-containing protein [Betaproteobacteria bacterium]|jgi:uncharacterized protein (DUF305 family)|nr:DUF305 domain-containing protein [Betaproteobacteria bacterium]